MTMRQDWENLRAVWNSEAKRVGQKALAEKVTPPSRPKYFNQGYISKLGRGGNQFTEEILELFSQYMGRPLVDLFSCADPAKITQEVTLMVEIQECLELMAALPEFKRGILAHADVLKVTFKDQVAAVKKNRAGSKILNP